jgi:hypothetical protein
MPLWAKSEVRNGETEFSVTVTSKPGIACARAMEKQGKSLNGFYLPRNVKLRVAKGTEHCGSEMDTNTYRFYGNDRIIVLLKKSVDSRASCGAKFVITCT